jgi:hypothetical protein
LTISCQVSYFWKEPNILYAFHYNLEI